MSETKTYQGSCHCGNVQFEVTMPSPEKAMACNCSICSKTGARMAFVGDEAFKLKKGEDTLRDYQFGKKNLHHPFCSTCGIRSFARGAGPGGAPMYMINLLCLEGMNEAGKLPTEWFDGASL